ncbi:DUF3515 family protein [Microbacterium aurantiacum]|uniref:DUF3515 family protein n=1 Tax=Microbacterium aurantiacum TaxID=162393 RepID=A0A0M8MFE0_9MICO|nr:DUF3515 family protein [Microbacterium chocolatum]ANG85923.1 hypothetical protein A8L33_11495 [Microbacterium chocolatum]KOS10348.1 hypothetical protein XI38_10945 [Microbacterium chocolatum]
MRAFSRLLTASALVATLAVLAGCAPTIAMEAAPQSNDPVCADVMVRLPDQVDGEPRRWTDAQATAAWGEPSASILLTCGLEPIGPTTLPCQTVAGVDWVIDESDAPRYRVTTFGRMPAVELYLDNERVSSAEVLDRLSALVSVLPTDGSRCLERGDAPDDEG